VTRALNDEVLMIDREDLRLAKSAVEVMRGYTFRPLVHAEPTGQRLQGEDDRNV